MKPIIEKYSFGRIETGGQSFDNDIELRWTGEVKDWWREESHMVYPTDLERTLKKKPELVIIGTGASGRMKVSKSAQDVLRNAGVQVIIDKTEEAVKTFNVILDKAEKEEDIPRKIIGLFHLTC